MKFLFVTLFPELIEQVCSYSIVGRGMSAGLLSVSCINPRDFTHDKHRTVDDSPFGGGAGMVLKPEPFVAAIRKAKEELPDARVIALCPGGRTLKQSIVEDYAHAGQDLIFVCGHYEGFDERIFNWVDEKLSVGDYVVTGGELPALTPWQGLFPACLAKWPVQRKIHSQPGFWNIRSIRALLNLKGWLCQRFCAAETMR